MSKSHERCHLRLQQIFLDQKTIGIYRVIHVKDMLVMVFLLRFLTGVDVEQKSHKKQSTASFRIRSSRGSKGSLV